MNRQCTKCGRQMQRIALPGQMDKFRCLPCTPTTVQMPGKAKATVSKVVKSYQEMPVSGNDGDTYFVEDMQAICRFDAEKDDWQILRLDQFKWEHKDDQFNDRRGAILAQRARKSRSHG